MRCFVADSVDATGAYWFWMKDSVWDESVKYYKGTIVYSTNDSERAVSPGFKKRVKFEGNLTSGWNRKSPENKCGILLCDLNKTDSGKYRFRFIGKERWVTNEVSLTVTGK